MAINGLLTDVRWQWTGTMINEGDLVAGTTLIPVEDPLSITPGEIVWIASTGPYEITDSDEEGATFTISPGLSIDVDNGTEVARDIGGRPGQTWSAEVVLPDAEQPIEVPLTIKDLVVMPEGVYDPPVAIILSDDLQEVIDLPDRLPEVQGSYVNPEGLPTPDPTYTWIKYADTPTSGMSDEPATKQYIGLAFNKTESTESTDYDDYEWSLFRGADGQDGVQGPPGDDGSPTYTWIKYADSAAGAGMQDSPNGKDYIGLAHNKPTPVESNTPSDYVWSLFRGPQGVQGATGSQGIQGPAGANGQSLYTWLKYADTPTTGMSDLPANKTYIGIAYNKTTSTESSNYGDYDWSLIKGPQGDPGAQGNQGVQGPPGADGSPRYTWIKYGTSSTGAGLSDDPAGKTYIGLAYNKTTAVESSTPGDYEWSLIQGPQGNTGAQGPQGNTGAQGPQGNQGVQGPPGADGTPRYTWIKYADSAAGAGLSDSPVGKIYFGIAYNKTTQTESSNGADYEWSLIQGPPGQDYEVPMPPAVAPTPEAFPGNAEVVLFWSDDNIPVGCVVDVYVSSDDGSLAASDVVPAVLFATNATSPVRIDRYADGSDLNLGEDTVQVAIVVRNADGVESNPSPWVRSNPGQILPEYMALLAGAVIADRLYGETVSGVRIEGSILDIAGALLAYEGFAEFTGRAKLQQVTITDLLNIYGLQNYIYGTLFLAAGVTTPGSAPTVATSYPISTAPATQMPQGVRGLCDSVDSTQWISVLQGIVVKMTKSTGAWTYQTLPYNTGQVVSYSATGITRLSNNSYFTIGTAYASTPYTEIRQYNSDFTQVLQRWDVGITVGDNPPTIGTTSDATLLASWVTKNGSLRVKEFNVTGTQIGTPTVLGDYSVAPVGAYRGPGPAGWFAASPRIAVTNKDSITLAFTSSGVPTSEGWSRAAGKQIVGQWWDGTRFWQMDSDGNIYRLSVYNGAARDYGFTWYDGNSGGAGLAETAISQKASLAAPKGSWISISTPAPPDDGTADGAAQVRIYSGLAGGALYRQATLTAAPWATPVAETFSQTGGTNPPASNQFAGRESANPGKLKTGLNGFSLDGSSKGTLGDYVTGSIYKDTRDRIETYLRTTARRSGSFGTGAFSAAGANNTGTVSYGSGNALPTAPTTPPRLWVLGSAANINASAQPVALITSYDQNGFSWQASRANGTGAFNVGYEAGV